MVDKRPMTAQAIAAAIRKAVAEARAEERERCARLVDKAEADYRRYASRNVRIQTAANALKDVAVVIRTVKGD